MQHLVFSIDHLFMLNFTRTDSYIDFELSNFWTVHWHTAIYRLFIAGAVFSHNYQAPFFAAVQNGPNDFLKQFSQMLQADRDVEMTSVHGTVFLLETDIDFLRKFLVF